MISSTCIQVDKDKMAFCAYLFRSSYFSGNEAKFHGELKAVIRVLPSPQEKHKEQVSLHSFSLLLFSEPNAKQA